ncbi:MAG: DsbC family protein [Bacteroidota bacterium]
MIPPVKPLSSILQISEIHFMKRVFLSFFLSCALSAPVFAGEADAGRVKAELVRAFPELSKATVKPAPVPGLYQVEDDAQVFYTTSDGKYLFVGDLVDVGAHASLTEARRAELRVQMLNAVGEKNMIVMGPDKPKRTLTVFTDVDCPYCAKFHLDVPTLNQAGVKVRYLFFPRTGIGSESYKRAVAVWCASDRVKAIGIAKAGGKLDMKTCPNPVEHDYQLGQRLGVEGTPTIFLDDGKKLPGYVPAPRLLVMLGLKGEPAGTVVR